MKNCPYCDELIQDKAIKCRYCHEWLEEPPKDRIVVEEQSAVAENVAPLSDKEVTICERLEKLPDGEVVFLYRAIHKYFEDEPEAHQVDREVLKLEALKLFREQQKATEALFSIYQI